MSAILDRLGASVRRAAAHEAFLTVSCAVAFGLVFSYPVLLHLGVRGTGNDWDFFGHLEWAAVRTVRHYHQLPLWNPWRCGGIPMVANPQSRILTPFFLLSLLFGPFIGVQLEIPLHLMIAWAGGYALGRTLKMGKMGAACCATVFPASSWFYLHLAAGHAPFLGITYLPWILAAACLGVERRRLGYGMLAGALIALIFFEGGDEESAYAALTLLALLFAMALERESPWPIWIGLAAAFFTAGFGAIKFLPALAFYVRHPRTMDGGESNPIAVLLTGLFAHNQDHYRHGLPGGGGFWEQGAYLGLFVIPAALGLFAGRRALPWLFVAVLFFALARGASSAYAPWPLLHKLPLLRDTRLPTRLLIYVVMACAVLAGFGIDWLLRVKPPWGGVFAVLVWGAATLDCLFVTAPNLGYIFQRPLEPAAMTPVFRQFRQPRPVFMLALAERNLGAVDCYEYTDIPTNVLGLNQAGYRGEQYLLGAGTLKLLNWTPEALALSLNLPRPTVMVVNQNYNPGWRVARGRAILFNETGLLGAWVPKGRERLVLRFSGGSELDWGALISAITLLLALLVWFDAWRVFAARSSSPPP